MAKLNAYLNFPGNAEEAFGFYKSVFGGQFRSLVRFKYMPMPGVKLPKEDETKIMHIALPKGANDVLMASDALVSHGRKLVVGNNVYLSIFPDSKEEADRIFGALAASGSVEMPLATQVWGDYYGSLIDKFGIRWMVDLVIPK